MSNIMPYSRQLIEDDDIQAVLKVLKSDYLTQGPEIAAFEKELAEYTGARYAVLFSSGTAALHGAYFAAGLKAGEEVITTPNTFAATANAALYLGGRPVFADIELKTGNINLDLIEEKITTKTKILTVVDYSGYPVDMDRARDIAKKYGLVLVEDACHSLGAYYKSKKIGTLADMTILSFHPVKSITTGEGGAVLTDNEEYYHKLLLFRQHGISKENFINEAHGTWYYEMQLLGYNYRMSDIQAALGRSQLKKLDRFIARRREIISFYQEFFSDNEYFDFTVEEEGYFSSWHLFPIRLKEHLITKKRKIFEALRAQGLWVQVHYIPVYWLPFYQSLGYPKGICPNAEKFYESEISIPVYQAMTLEDARKVASILLEVLQNV
ncbi:UDP-4-amino-4,6-dideoxy-N-acetyl-beta-L-altrosamine transaminase [Carboxydothermus pertinax]|uniref:UDP-4-amino-4, 6-dideoxy-N-acetyl-beta-L-altrosamine transaminase n=1 Tax=Carboxydothermus pertinax TaxID=870242 RepID=A0A1L8CUC5_9THEO|nr:UDP-4-amino-4,6-dideoxy-N-acetyl-beta-L-altrosamine transaminase [Carboxydothermus pertinax]GAV22545.1 putative protein MJ1066 [Carboxydothermus pertinax]